MEYLFVYGSLMHAIDSAIARFLKAHSTFIGEATMPGVLYDLGRYPGAVFDAKCEETVIGHIFQLHDAEQIFSTLDRYEGIDPQQPEASEYRRARVPIQHNDTELPCWTYLYNLPTSGLRKIPGGNYLAYLQGNSDYQAFIRSV